MHKYSAILLVALGVLSCSPEPEPQQDRSPEPTSAPASENPFAKVAAPAGKYEGWIALGGALTLGEGAAIGQDYPGLLAREYGVNIRNAAIAGEGTSGLLQRLPRLTEQQPTGFILELGAEEAAGRPASALRRDLRRLQRLLKGYPVIVINSAVSVPHQEAIREFAANKDWAYLEAGSQKLPADRLSAQLFPLLSGIKE